MFIHFSRIFPESWISFFRRLCRKWWLEICDHCSSDVSDFGNSVVLGFYPTLVIRYVKFDRVSRIFLEKTKPKGKLSRDHWKSRDFRNRIFKKCVSFKNSWDRTLEAPLQKAENVQFYWHLCFLTLRYFLLFETSKIITHIKLSLKPDIDKKRVENSKDRVKTRWS